MGEHSSNVSTNAIGYVIMSAAALVLGGCSLTGEPRIESNGPGVVARASVSFTSSDSSTSMQRIYQAALKQSMIGNGLVVVDGNGENSTYLADFAISTRPSESAIAAQAGKTNAPEYVSPPRKRRFLQECSGERLRATLLIFDQSNGGLAFRGVREVDQCDVTDAAVSAMAHELVESAIRS